MNSKNIAAYIIKPDQLYKRVVDLIVSGTGEARLIGVSIEYPKSEDESSSASRREKMLVIPSPAASGVVTYGSMRSDSSSVFTKGISEKRLALEDLHKFFLTKKKGVNYTSYYEKLIKLYILLCVDTKDLKFLKDGLHHYRNLVQNVDQESLDRVLEYLVDLAERQADNAQKLAKRIAGAEERASSADSDVPESMMLKGMTAEDSKDRANKELVVPWLKFLWESFKQILDLLHKNPKYEKTYHGICARAFKFCMDNRRTQEFHKLCETLRAHLLSLKKLLQAPTSNNINWEWSALSVKYNLNTRYLQLEVADKLEMWNEAFRTIKDIQEVIKISKKFLKSDMMDMDKYYENLAKIFYVSDNYLFHAYCLLKNYTLLFLSDFKTDHTEEDRRAKATAVLLAALIVPSTGVDSQEHNSGGSSILNFQDQDNIFKENQDMATLLDFQVVPTRENLLQDIVDKGILRDASPEYAIIFEKLERSFKPLSLPKDLKDSVSAVIAEPFLKPYGEALQRAIVVRVAQQLSRVYKQVDIGKVQNVLGWSTKDPSVHVSRSRSEYLPDLTYSQVEKIMIEAVVKKLLNVRVDHIKNSLIFGSESAAGLAVDERLTTFSQKMQKLQNDLDRTIRLDKKDKIDYNLKCFQDLDDACYDFENRRQLIHLFRIGLSPALVIDVIPSPDIDVSSDDISSDGDNIDLDIEEERKRLEACHRIHALFKNLGDLTSSEKSKFDQLTKKFKYLQANRDKAFEEEKAKQLKSYNVLKNKDDKKPPHDDEIFKHMKWDKFEDVCKISGDVEQPKKNIENLLKLTDIERSDVEFVIKTIGAVRRQKEEQKFAKELKEVNWSHIILQKEYAHLASARIREQNERNNELTKVHSLLLEHKHIIDQYFFKDVLDRNEEIKKTNEATELDNKRLEEEYKEKLLSKAIELKEKRSRELNEAKEAKAILEVNEQDAKIEAMSMSRGFQSGAASTSQQERYPVTQPAPLVSSGDQGPRASMSLSDPSSSFGEQSKPQEEKWSKIETYKPPSSTTPTSSSAKFGDKYSSGSRSGTSSSGSGSGSGGGGGYNSKFNSDAPPPPAKGKYTPQHLRDKK